MVVVLQPDQGGKFDRYKYIKNRGEPCKNLQGLLIFGITQQLEFLAVQVEWPALFFVPSVEMYSR
jgi:hypothetical protein